jgi:hypothetical protein
VAQPSRGTIAAVARLGRTVVDRRDDSRAKQIKLVYCVPNDRDRRLDTSGALNRSFGSIQNWLKSKTGGRYLRVDKFNGRYDIMFVRLRESDAEVAEKGAFVRDHIEEVIRRRGLLRPNKVYAVWYDGTSHHACGGGAWPPTLPGQVAALYLNGLPDSDSPCGRRRFAADAKARPGFREYAMLHEIVHTLGGVPARAPNHHRAGHVRGQTNDLMYAGEAPWRFPCVLDPGRNDYYGHGREGMFDLARSGFLVGSPHV